MSGTVSLSGFLPGEDAEGLTTLAEQLIEAWTAARRKGRDPAGATEVVVVGVLRGASLKEHRDPTVKPPVLELRFAALEPVKLTGQRDQLLMLVRQLADDRQEVQALPGIDDAGLHDLPDPNNVREPDRPRRRRPKSTGPDLRSIDGGAEDDGGKK